MAFVLPPTKKNPSQPATADVVPEAHFILGAASTQQFPIDDLAEIAFVGRSNVGKSALLNRVLHRRNLARVSRTPGRTREINFFRVGKRWWFVDLPGYGYAKVAKSKRLVWDQLIGGYFEQRRNLRAVILLLDLRRGLTDLDQALLTHLDHLGIPSLPVATKVDKLNSNSRRQALLDLEKTLRQASAFILIPAVSVSSLNGDGIPVLWQRLRQILATPTKTTANNPDRFIDEKHKRKEP